MSIQTTQRLYLAIISAIGPIESVSVGIHGDSTTIKVLPADKQAAAQATIDAFDWSQGAEDAFANLQARTQGQALLADSAAHLKLLRGAIAVLLDEINILRSAAALPPRTMAQAKSAITDKITAGTVDT